MMNDSAVIEAVLSLCEKGTTEALSRGLMTSCGLNVTVATVWRLSGQRRQENSRLWGQCWWARERMGREEHILAAVKDVTQMFKVKVE